MPTYSISMRLRRTRVEYAFVSVPIDEHVLERDPEDNTKLKINPERLSEVAKQLGMDRDVLWAEEGSPLIELHPLQTAPPRACADDKVRIRTNQRQASTPVAASRLLVTYRDYTHDAAANAILRS